MSSLREKFTKNNAIFSSELFSTLAKADDPTKNIIFSPISIQTCVALVYAGAAGKTAQEIVKGLHLVSNKREEVAASYAEFLKSYTDNALVKIANKIYVHQGFKLNESYKEITGKYFNSEADTMDVSDPTATANKINKWVEDKTNNKIKQLISARYINSLTRLVLVNAIYFKGSWAKKFNPENTIMKNFYYNENQSEKVDMMTQKSKFRYGVFAELDACTLELPYADSNISMLIVLPNSRTGIKKVGSKLKNMSIFEISQKMYETDVNVVIPKFKIEYAVELNETLKTMGMSKMFPDSAEFDNMLEKPEGLMISKVLHKAFIEVYEEGTEAAAATAIIMKVRSAPRPPKEFIADHPFIYIIWDQKNILFAGRNVKFDKK